MDLLAFVRFTSQVVYVSPVILGCTVNCRFRFDDCPLIDCEHKVKHFQNSDTKTGNWEPYQNHRLGTVSNWLLWGGGGGEFKSILRRQRHPQLLTWYKHTYSWLFGSHDKLLTRQWIIKVNK